MVKDFKAYKIEEFHSFIRSVSINRKITHIQIHHTWRPRKADYKGEATIVSMWRYHTETRGWQDIGQHFSVAPDGTIWDGRPLNLDPAGITGHNTGGIMFEIIGDFDKGEDVLEGIQLDAIIAAVRVLMEKCKLTLKDIIFHRDYSTKTCPGTSISKEWFLNEVSNRKIISLHSSSDNNAEQWKQKAVDWLYEEGLLSDNVWKNNIEKGLPLWAEALVLKRLFEKSKNNPSL